MKEVKDLSAQSAAPYEALVRKYHPQGRETGYYAGCTRRKGGKRMTDVCRHEHATEGEAQTCADHLASLRATPAKKGDDA